MTQRQLLNAEPDWISTDRGWLSSESAAAVEEDEDHGGASQGDQGKGGEVGDQVEVDAHGWPRRDANH
jgi:hypothetical protein